jgi:hypothetical protein
MVALVADRATPRREGNYVVAPVATATLLYAGALLMRNAAGFITRGATATGSVGVGVADEQVNNTGANGALNVRYRTGVFQFLNSASTDLITIADIGRVCFIVTDSQVARTNGSTTRSPAGIVEAVDANGVWVRFDEALTRAS